MAAPALTAAERTLLLQLTSLPTAAGREDAVHAFLGRWLKARASRLHVRRDDAGNLLVTQRGNAKRGAGPAPLLFTAHLDHPAFVCTRQSDPRTVELEFRGGVHDPYFHRARLEVLPSGPAGRSAPAQSGASAAPASAKPVAAVIQSLDAKAQPFKRVVARLARAAVVPPGSIARWKLPAPRIAGGMLRTHACDDLAAAAAALIAFERILRRRDRAATRHVGLLFTVAEEVGFIGAIKTARDGFVPRNARLVCLENSRSFPTDSPIGAGAIMRVGDRLSVFRPELTNALSILFGEEQARNAGFRWQRKLMPGGACEATAFASFGLMSTCLCLPLGNYHNMCDIDGVLKGRRPARVGPEFVSMADVASLVRMLEVAAVHLDERRNRAPRRARPAAPGAEFRPLMDRLWRERAAAVLPGTIRRHGR